MDSSWNRSKRSSFSVGSFQASTLDDYHRYGLSYQQQQQQIPLHQQQQLPARSAFYESHWPLYAADWTTRPHQNNDPDGLVAVSTYREDSVNRIEILQSTASSVEHANGHFSDGLDIVKISESSVDLPITKLQWDPTPSPQVARLISTNDRLKLWDVDDFNNMLVERASLVNNPHTSTQGQSLPPLTSFDWNKVSPNLVITSSMDTTCTVWDLNSITAPKTQLIAHDSEVFDVQFIKGSSDIFASVGADGSMRVFDLRALDHSTIVYEPPPPIAGSAATAAMAATGSARGNIPLLRLATSNTDPNLIATFRSNSEEISIMDLRYPGQPTLTLLGHSAKLNSIKWHPSESKLLSGADDCQALVWDLSNGGLGSRSNSKNVAGVAMGNNGGVYPDFAYSDTFEVNNVCWAPDGEWCGIVSGKGFQGVKMGS